MIMPVSRVVLLCILVLAPAALSAEQLYQHADIDILPDLSAKGRWALPVNTGDGDVFAFPEHKNFGFTGSFDYRVTGAANEKGPVTFSHEAGDQAYVQTGYPSGDVTRYLYVDYATVPPIKSPLVLYEFFVFGGGYFFSPQLAITYPDKLTLLSAWPPPTAQKPLKIAYPPKNSYVYPIVTLFRPNPLPPGVVIERQDSYTIAGDAASVRAVASAIRSMPPLGDIVTSYLDAPLPAEVFVLVTDLSDIAYSNEPSGLAVRPNIILVNKALLLRQDPLDVELLIAHETAHLVEMGKELFNGATFIAPWFREGIATAVELDMYERRAKSDAERARYNRFGSYRDHLLSAGELERRYEKEFDYLLDGSHPYSVTSAYGHAALAMRAFRKSAGEEGMRALFTKLETADSSQLCSRCDSDLIARTMANLSGQTPEYVLFPERESPDALAPKNLIETQHEEAVEDRVILDYLSNEVHSYFSGDGTPSGAPVRPVSAVINAEENRTTVATPTKAAPLPPPPSQKLAQGGRPPNPTAPVHAPIMPAKHLSDRPAVATTSSVAKPAPEKPKKKSNFWKRLFSFRKPSS